MSDNRTIEYKLVIDTETGQKTVTDLNGKVVDLDKITQDYNKNSQESFDKSIAKLRDVSLAYDGLKNAVNNIVSVFAEMSNESEDAVNAELKLKVALKNVFDESDQTLESIKRHSQEMQNMTVVDGDAINKLAGLGLQMGIQKERINEATEGAIGLSRAFDLDLNSAMKQVANGFEQNYDMLGRYIPSIRNATTETEKAALFNKALADGFAFAKAETDTFRGTIEQLKNKIGDLKENFGSLINNIILPLVKLLDNDLVLAAGVAIATMTALAIPVYTLTTAFTALSEAVTASTGGLNLVIAAIAAAGIGTAIYITNTKKASEETKQFAKELDNLKNSITKLSAEQLQKSADEIITLTHGYDIVIAKKQEQLAKIIDEQKKADAQNDQLNYNRLDNEKQLIQQSIDFQIERKKSLLDQLVIIDNQQSENTKAKLKELSEAEIKAMQEAAEKQKAFENEQHEKRLNEATTYREKLKAIRDQYDADDKAAYKKKILEQGIGGEYTPEMQLADQQIVDEILLEQKRKFETEVLNIETGTHEARLAALANDKITYDQYQTLELATKAKTEKAKQDLNRQTALNGAKDMLSNLQALKSLGAEAAAIAKSAAVASTTIDTIQAAQKSYTWGASWGGPFGGAAMAAIAYAAGIARVAQITSTATGFKDGGYTGSGSDDEVAGVAHKNEVIIPAPVVRKIGIDRAVSIAAGVASVPDFAGSETSKGLSGIAGRLGAINANIVNSSDAPAPIVNINTNIDWLKFEYDRRFASNELDKTGLKQDNNL